MLWPTFKVEEIRKLVDFELGYVTGAPMASSNYKVRGIDSVHQACESSAWWIIKISLCADQRAIMCFRPDEQHL